MVVGAVLFRRFDVSMFGRFMKPGFVPGIVREVVITVTEDMCPAFDGKVVHRCYSTWSVAHHFEIAARKVLVDFLEANEEGVGSHVSVDHLAPCGVGRRVTVRAELVERTQEHHPRVVCDLTAHEGDRLLARGRQVQVVMNKEHLRKYIERS
jgi:predicted thioesterase